MSPTDPTPLWLSAYLPLGVACLLLVVGIVCLIVGWLRGRGP